MKEESPKLATKLATKNADGINSIQEVNIDDDEVIEKILRHLELWPEQATPACLSRAPPSIPPPDGGERIVELCFDDPFQIRNLKIRFFGFFIFLKCELSLLLYCFLCL